MKKKETKSKKKEKNKSLPYFLFEQLNYVNLPYTSYLNQITFLKWKYFKLNSEIIIKYILIYEVLESINIKFILNIISWPKARHRRIIR